MYKIIAIVGLCGTGKSIVSDYLVDKKGFVKVYFGAITLDEIEKRGLPSGEQSERIVREQIRQQHGKGAYTLLSIPKIEALLDKRRKIAIDGLYSMEEYKLLKNRYAQDLVVLALFAPKKLRYYWLAERKERPLLPHEIEERDFAEIENLDKAGPIALADTTIINDGTREELLNKVEYFIKELESRGEVC